MFKSVLRVGRISSNLFSRSLDLLALVPGHPGRSSTAHGGDRMLPGAGIFPTGASFMSMSRGSPSPMRAGLIRCALFATAASTPLGSLSAQADVTGPPAAADSANLVQPGDMIRLKIWREPDMSGDVTVDEQGVATLPRIGALRVSGVRADSLKRLLVHSYAKYLRDPSVDITVLRRVTILGAVRTPNVYQVEPTMTVSDALALAGGATPDGKQDQVELRRRGGGKPVLLYRGSRLGDTPIRSGDELYIPQRSWLSRNPGLVIGSISTVLSILYFVSR